jgi:hypothetical protein
MVLNLKELKGQYAAWLQLIGGQGPALNDPQAQAVSLEPDDHGLPPALEALPQQGQQLASLAHPLRQEEGLGGPAQRGVPSLIL